MLKRLFALLLVLMLVVPAVGAQESTVYCGDLAEADCALLTNSQSVMSEISAAGFDFELNFDMDAGPESISLGMAGDGAFAGDMDVMKSLEGFDTEDFEEILAMLTGFLKSFKGQLNFEIDLPTELMMEVGIPELKFELLLTEGVIYADAGPLMGSPTPMWMGIDLVLFIDAIMAEAGDMGAMDMDMDMMDMEDFDLSMFEEMGNQFMTITRVDDEQVDGVTVAVFQSTFDLSGMMSSEPFQGFLMEIMAAQGADLSELDMDAGELLGMVAAMYENSTFIMEQWIGVDDYYPYYSAMYMEFTMDMEAIVMSMGMPADDDMPGAITMVMEGELSLYDFNEPVEIIVPEGAMVIDPMMFLGSGF
jgi:hypothetical protein